MASANEQLAAALKAAEEANARVEQLKKATKAEDLATVKRLIKLHGFGPTDLRNVIKAKRKSKSEGEASTSAKKQARPRKSTGV